MTDKSLIEQADELGCIPKNWPVQREEATDKLVSRMAREIERLSRIVNHLCPDKSDDV